MANEYGAIYDGRNVIIRPNTGGQILTEGAELDRALIKSHPNYTGSGFLSYTAVATTTDATVTTIATIPVPVDGAVAVRAMVVGKRPATIEAVASTVIAGGGYRNASAAAVVTAASTVTIIESSSGTPAITLVASGNNLILTVAGEASKTFHWAAAVEVVTVVTNA